MKEMIITEFPEYFNGVRSGWDDLQDNLTKCVDKKGSEIVNLLKAIEDALKSAPRAAVVVPLRPAEHGEGTKQNQEGMARMKDDLDNLENALVCALPSEFPVARTTLDSFGELRRSGVQVLEKDVFESFTVTDAGRHRRRAHVNRYFPPDCTHLSTTANENVVENNRYFPPDCTHLSTTAMKTWHPPY